MTVITEPARETSVIRETELLVVGSGPGGLSAALAAARAGVDVTLVERFGCFGGNITAVGVEGMAWYRHEETVEAFREILGAAGLAHPDDLRPWHLNRRVSETDVKSYARIYDFLDPGELLSEPYPGRYGEWLERASADRFLVACKLA